MQIANLAKKLEAVGLTEKQAKVYVAALFLGPAAVQRIAEQAEVNRATTYVILAELADMGLVSETTEGKKTVFVAEPPDAIDRYLGAMEKEIDDRKVQLKGVMKELNEVNRSEIAGDAPVVRFFKGPEAILALSSYLKRKAKPNEVVYGMTNLDELDKMAPGYTETNALKRKKKKIAGKGFYSGSRELVSDPESLRETIKLTEDVRADLNLYEERASIVTYSGDQPVGIVIEGKELVSVLRQLFDLAWKNHKKK
ncbi:MAG: HTH-type transcriptional regulator, sugar sensing transcriptional regulator [Patescibacteria group bacterium]|jgi:sugar-specific transcriptional regulator TrmB|nr:HTH-type transcriptional regulator, sugar sensing transcriptional regulator [Patescibacteria group bacterium]